MPSNRGRGSCATRFACNQPGYAGRMSRVSRGLVGTCLVAAIVGLMGACTTDEDSEPRGSFGNDVDTWLAAVCNDDAVFSDRSLFVGSTGGMTPQRTRSCDEDPSYVHATALLFDSDPRARLAGRDEEGSTFYCWAKRVDDGWAAVVFEDYEIDDDPLAALEEFDFSAC